MNKYNKRPLPKTEEQIKAMKLTVLNKYTRLWINYKEKGSAGESLAAGFKDLWLWFQRRREMRLMEWRQHSGTGRGRRRLFEHTRDQGEQVETLGNQGRQSDT